MQRIQTRIPALSETLADVASAEAECAAANVEENDYTVFTCQDLEFELELVVQSIAKKIAFIDNQVGLIGVDMIAPLTKAALLDRFTKHDQSHARPARAVRRHIQVLRQG